MHPAGFTTTDCGFTTQQAKRPGVEIQDFKGHTNERKSRGGVENETNYGISLEAESEPWGGGGGGTGIGRAALLEVKGNNSELV